MKSSTYILSLIICFLAVGTINAQKIFCAKGMYISEGAKVSINSKEVILDSIGGKGTIHIGKNTMEIVVSDKSILKQLKINEKEYLVKNQKSRDNTDSDQERIILVKREIKENLPKQLAKPATIIISSIQQPLVSKTEKKKDSRLSIVRIIHTFEKKNTANGGIIIPDIISIAPLTLDEIIHIPNIFIHNKKSNPYGYMNDYSYCTYAEILKPPIIA